MGGSISVDSSPGRGSRFSVTLPSRERATVDSRAPQAVKPLPVERRASVLVVDDETMMCELLRNMLQDDYATTFSSSRAALDRMLEPQLFEVVLCDLMMPELTGMDLYAELMRKRPEQAARFVFMTGGTFTDRASEFLESIVVAPLTKTVSQRRTTPGSCRAASSV